MIRQIKQQLNQKSTPQSPQTDGDLNYSSVEEQSDSSFLSLTDADYEFLFNQLLEGVAHGWHSVKIAKFFQRLGERGEQPLWIDWLERYQTKILTSSNPYQQQLGARMIRLGEMTQSTASVKQIGITSYNIGKQILYGTNTNLVWEYNGADLSTVGSELGEEEIVDSAPEKISEPRAEVSEVVEEQSQSNPSAPETQANSELEQNELEIPAQENEENLVIPQANLVTDEQTEQLNLTAENTINLSWQEFTELIEQDDQLVEQIAKQLNLQDKDPQTIIKAVTSQLNNDEADLVDDSTFKLVESWFNLGLKQVSTGDLEAAIVSWEKALELNPNLAEAWHNRGSALGRLHNYQEALISFEQALKIDPQNSQAWNDRAHTLYQLEQWQEAVASWDRAIALVPGNYQFWYNRGCALEQLQQNSIAIASYEKALEIKPDFQWARSRYTNLLAHKHPIN